VFNSSPAQGGDNRDAASSRAKGSWGMDSDTKKEGGGEVSG